MIEVKIAIPDLLGDRVMRKGLKEHLQNCMAHIVCVGVTPRCLPTCLYSSRDLVLFHMNSCCAVVLPAQNKCADHTPFLCYSRRHRDGAHTRNHA